MRHPAIDMVQRLSLLGCVAILLWHATPVESADPPAETSPAVFYFIAHTHWEGAVFKTREEYLEMGLPNILRALELLKKYPDYRFVLDQACYVQPFLERYPQEKQTFLQFVKEGRLAIVGGTDVMLDVNMPSGESFVRQVLYGKGYFRRALGVDVHVGWQLDTFGHHAQMPQLMKLGGFNSFWFFRGVADWSNPSEFLWEGLDGTQIPAFWLPHSYAHTYGSPGTLPEFTEFMKGRYDALAPFSPGPHRVGLAGADVCQPEEQVPILTPQFNAQEGMPFELRMAVPSDYEAATAERSDLKVIGGELNPIFQGAYSSRIELKQRTRELERLLTTAEKLGSVLNWRKAATNNQALWRAWEPMLFNQAHDLMSGVMTDRVYEDTIRSYDFSGRIAREEVVGRWRRLAREVDTRGPGVPIVVYNSLSWPRTDVAIAQVGFSTADVQDLKVIAADGSTAPVQVLNCERYANGALLQAEIAFIARDVPSLGHAVYHLQTLAEPQATSSASPDEQVLANEYYHVTCDPASGALTSIKVQPEGWEALSGPANIVAKEEDHGDLWEPYRPLDGGSRIAMKTVHGVPEAGKAMLSSEGTAEPGSFTRGPVLSQLKVAHPWGEQGSFATTVRIFNGLPRIEIHTEILNQDKFVRYRALFPTTIHDGKSVHEIPFGAFARPIGIEFPAQNWVDYSNGQQGVALLNRGLPGNNVADDTLILSLLRSTQIVAYGFGGGYEPGMSSESGFELGKKLAFDYALVPHAGSWNEAEMYRRGLEFNQPLVCYTAAPHAGPLPAQWGFVDISAPNVVLSALKPGPEGSTVLRVYEAAGKPTQTNVRLAAHVSSAQEVNLMEDPGTDLEVTDNSLQLDLRPFEIKTIRMILQ